jgi:glycosyltransferase involved in cell wall biosynthesis
VSSGLLPHPVSSIKQAQLMDISSSLLKQEAGSKNGHRLPPRFSIIIPTLNSAEKLSAAIESVLNQTYSNFEIWITDGRSSDGTIDIIKSFAESDARIKWISEKDDGIYDAMNRAVTRSSAEWLFFLGSDDSLHGRNVLSDVNKTITEQKHTRIIYGNVQLVTQKKTTVFTSIEGGPADLSQLVEKNICHQAIFYHKNVFSKVGLYNTKYRVFADWDLNLRCFKTQPSSYINRTISNFNTNGFSSKNVDRAFQADLVNNMLFSYPYSYREKFFLSRKKHLARILFREIKGLRVGRAFRVLKTILYHTVNSGQQLNFF